MESNGVELIGSNGVEVAGRMGRMGSNEVERVEVGRMGSN